jgi:hypothetical protein
MMKDANDLPIIADDAGLGVRHGVDIRTDSAGNAIIEKKGMSVFEGWRDIPFSRRPERLGNGGRGPDDTHCFRHGEGPFLSGAVNQDLDLLVPMGKNPKHGGIRPAQLVQLAAFRANLHATQPNWVLDES